MLPSDECLAECAKGFLPVAEDGCAIDACCKGSGEGEGEQQQQHGDDELPNGYAEGDAEKHSDRRGEGDDREDGGECAGRLRNHDGEKKKG